MSDDGAYVCSVAAPDGHALEVRGKSLAEVVSGIIVGWPRLDPKRQEIEHRALLHFYGHIANGEIEE